VKDIYDLLREVRQRPDESFALATLVRVEGSSYRRPGARMLICKDGKTVGSLSAGCLEEEVALRAREVLRTGQPTLMSFDTRKRFGCAGKIDILIERLSTKFFTDAAEQLAARRRCWVRTIFRGRDAGSEIVSGIGFQPMRHRQDADATNAFVQEIQPPIRLFIFGDGPDSKAFHSLANLLGWQTLEIIDANKLPGEPDEWTAAIVKSHNYGRDFAALQKLLPLDLRYVGLIGPRKRRNQLLSDLLEQGVTINAGFFAPAGIDLGAETPEEIALAVISEIQRVFSGGSGESLRDRKISIHANAARSFQAKSRMERLGKPRHGRKGRRLSEREVSESNPEAASKSKIAGSFDSASLRSG
jgi:xanthine dehydrogenase accessory factor